MFSKIPKSKIFLKTFLFKILYKNIIFLKNNRNTIFYDICNNTFYNFATILSKLNQPQIQFLKLVNKIICVRINVVEQVARNKSIITWSSTKNNFNYFLKKRKNNLYLITFDCKRYFCKYFWKIIKSHIKILRHRYFF